FTLLSPPPLTLPVTTSSIVAA
ncbi:hypothetical protein CCACVL1_24338, partial [Corchorus capsularis]